MSLWLPSRQPHLDSRSTPLVSWACAHSSQLDVHALPQGHGVIALGVKVAPLFRENVVHLHHHAASQRASRQGAGLLQL